MVIQLIVTEQTTNGLHAELKIERVFDTWSELAEWQQRIDNSGL